MILNLANQQILESKIIKNRQCFLESLGQLPEAIEHSLNSHFKERISATQERFLLGESMPWLVADIYGVANDPCIDQIALLWTHVYFAILLLDDVIDGSYKGDKRVGLIAGNLMLQNALCRLVANSEDSPRFARLVNQSFNTTADAAVWEFSSKDNHDFKYCEKNLHRLADKSAYLYLCVGAIAELNSDSNNMEEISSAFQKLLSGIQLLDDLTDWKHDIQRDQITYVLEQASLDSSTLEARERSTIESSYEKQLIQIVSSGAAEKTLKLAHKMLLRAQLRLADGGISNRTLLVDYIVGQMSNINKTLSMLAKVQKYLMESNVAGVSKYRESQIVGQIENAFQIVAQSC